MAATFEHLRYPTDDWLTITEASRRTKLQRQYVSELIRADRLDAVRVLDAEGRPLATFVSRPSLEAFMAVRVPRAPRRREQDPGVVAELERSVAEARARLGGAA